ncbi:hypothetical protein PPERSA_12249 [Pseudocohnilembus persalinus]|uniref:Transmembrane protein n=1 Tax=Pseudocohnilembus persalinus TaxID=266149 RepID=A0A0V0R4T9_PSEPJ|nr:hypothetical protein PPERSA_12249 [Pseudocohnilembus persalinus]|eukprot:KRX09506.1 hypothetical protein PPERSA_12249 [Pseudocohnilembus persalinus]
MISAGLLTGGIFFNALGYYQLKKGSKLVELFQRLEKIQVYNYNYLDSIQKIVNKKQVTLAANLPPWETKNFKTHIQVKSKDQEHNYVRHDGDFKFFLHSARNGFLKVVNKSQKTRIYNITKGEKAQNLNQVNLNQFQKWMKPFLGNNFYEFNLAKEGQQYVFIGNLVENPDYKEIEVEQNQNQNEQKINKEEDNREEMKQKLEKQQQVQKSEESKYIFQTELILGENKDFFMQFLDKYIVETRNKQYLFFGIGSILILTHFVMFNYGKKKEQKQMLESGMQK